MWEMYTYTSHQQGKDHHEHLKHMQCHCVSVTVFYTDVLEGLLGLWKGLYKYIVHMYSRHHMVQ